MDLYIGQEVAFQANFMRVSGHIRAFRANGDVVITLNPKCDWAVFTQRPTFKVHKDELKKVIEPKKETFFND